MTGHAGDRIPPHQPVLYKEIIHALQPHHEGSYVDGTLGAGGHAHGILEASSPSGRLLGLDVDPEALAVARERLEAFEARIVLVRASYTTIREQVASLGWQGVDGVLLDLGLSSMQLESPQRGFSFQTDGPLDMRFDPDGERRASDLVNGLPEKDLADLLYRYADERRSRQIARAIVQARPIETTASLAEVIVRSLPPGRSRDIHPATRTFQALRIAVNDELQSLERALPQAVGVLLLRGRLAVISFHSLEDRVVKRFFQQESRDCLCPPQQPVCTCGHRALVKPVTRKPIRPGKIEVMQNPRARSARLRVVEKIRSSPDENGPGG